LFPFALSIRERGREEEGEKVEMEGREREEIR